MGLGPVRWPSSAIGSVRQALSETAIRACAGNLQVGYRLPAIIAPMKIINLLHVVCAQAFYKWAMKEISPMHPDVPKIMMRQHQLNEKYRRIWA
jgi:hypothetical protein